MKPISDKWTRALRVRSRNSIKTCAEILRAAERIFAEVGLAGARTDAIAGAAGVNKAMLYYYFKSKVGLYRAVLEEQVKEFHRRAERVFASEGPAGSILLRYVSDHFDFIGARPYYPRLFQRLMMAGDQSVKQIIKQHFVPISNRLVALIEQGIQSGEFRSIDARHTAISIVALTVFYFSAAPVVRMVSGIDVFDRMQQTRRKKEVLKFVRYALFRYPEGVVQ